jgi:hypothetical protein
MDETSQFPLIGPSLNSAGEGLVLAHDVVVAVQSGRTVELNASGVERMTPSYANVLVMTLMEQLGTDLFRSKVRLINADEFVIESWDKAADRYARGIRLSTQRPSSAA